MEQTNQNKTDWSAVKQFLDNASPELRERISAGIIFMDGRAPTDDELRKQWRATYSRVRNGGRAAKQYPLSPSQAIPIWLAADGALKIDQLVGEHRAKYLIAFAEKYNAMQSKH